MTDERADLPDDEEEEETVIPFIVCKSRGGQYDDESFEAGFYTGGVDRALKIANKVGTFEAVFLVPDGVIPQLELIGMNYGFPVMEVVDADEEGQSLVAFRAADWEDESLTDDEAEDDE